MSALWVKQLKRMFQKNRGTLETRRAKQLSGHKQYRLQMEALEDRIVLNTYTVTNTSDNLAGSLRQGLLSGDSIIDFNIPIAAEN